MGHKKTYLVTVDLGDEQKIFVGQISTEESIAEALSAPPYYFANPEVKLAPASFQPLSNIEVRKNNES